MPNEVIHADHDAQELIAHFEEPSTVDPEYDEVFGWYYTDSSMNYLIHHTRDRRWKRQQNPQNATRPQDLVGFAAQEAAHVANSLDSLAWLDRPALPDNPNATARSEPFVFDGWLFRWLFVPELKRWELAPIEPRAVGDQAESRLSQHSISPTFQRKN